MSAHRCERCGRANCVDKRFVPWRLLDAVAGVYDCPRYYGPAYSPYQPTTKFPIAKEDRDNGSDPEPPTPTIPV